MQPWEKVDKKDVKEWVEEGGGGQWVGKENAVLLDVKSVTSNLSQKLLH